MCSCEWFYSELPDYVIVVSQVKFLLVFACVVHNSHTGHEVDYFLGGSVVQVVAALVSPVSVDPLQSQVAVWSSSVSHVRGSLCVSLSLSRSLSDTLSFTRGGLIKRQCEPSLPLDLRRNSAFGFCK